MFLVKYFTPYKNPLAGIFSRAYLVKGGLYHLSPVTITCVLSSGTAPSDTTKVIFGLKIALYAIVQSLRTTFPSGNSVLPSSG